MAKTNLQLDYFNAQRAPGFLRKVSVGKQATRTTTTLRRLSCSCYLVVRSVQAWRISTTVSCRKRQALFHLSELTEQGGGLWRGLTADDGLLGELNPLLFTPLITGLISAACHAFILWVVRGDTKATCTAGS